MPATPMIPSVPHPSLDDEIRRLSELASRVGFTAEVRAQWRALADAHSQRTDVLVHFADAELAGGDPNNALSLYRRTLSIEPENGRAWYGVGSVLVGRRDLDAAERAFAHARVSDRQNVTIANLHAWTLNEAGRTPEADALLGGLSARHPRDVLTALAHATNLPPIYSDVAEIAQRRARYKVQLDALAAKAAGDFDNPQDILRLARSQFLLTYQGECDRDLGQAYHRWQASLLQAVCPELCAPIPRKRRGGRIRVAFASADLRQCTIGNYFRSWIERLDRTRFEITMVTTGPRSDDVTASIARSADYVIDVRGNVLELARKLKDSGQDIIVYPEVGMNPAFVLLADLRLAPVQVAAWGHPTTTGATSVDTFLSCEGMEPDDASSHYSERLCLLPGIGTWYRAPEAVSPIPRDRLGLSPNQRIYVCPQTLFKIHPSNDGLFAELLRDPEAVLLLFQHESQSATRRLGERVATALKNADVPVRSQIKFLPVVSHDVFRSILATADVVLDTRHFSGGNTSLDAISVGVPLVTWPGSLMRGRQSLSMLRQLDLADCVVEDAAAYVETARRLATDRAASHEVRSAMVCNRHRIFEQQQPIDALMDIFESLHRSGST